MPKGQRIISSLAWVLIAVVGWVCLAAVVGLVLGRIIRNRDLQVPQDAARPSTAQVPAQQRRGPDCRPTPQGH